jgi:hypothetical protein
MTAYSLLVLEIVHIMTSNNLSIAGIGEGMAYKMLPQCILFNVYLVVICDI